MAPAVGNTNGASSGVQVASVAPSMPAGATSGDLICYAETVDSGSSGPSTGWTEIFQATAPSGTAAVMLGYRRFDGGANDTLTLTHDGSKAYSYVTWKVTGAHASTAPEAGGSATGTSANPDPASFNPTNWDVEDTLWIAVAGWDGTPTLSGSPSGYTLLRTERNGSATFGSGLSLYWLDTTPAASEDPGQFTISASEQWAAGVMAIRPAPSEQTVSLTPVSTTNAPVALSYGLSAPASPSSSIYPPRLGPPRGIAERSRIRIP